MNGDAAMRVLTKCQLLLILFSLALATFAAVQGHPTLIQLSLLLASALFFGRFAKRLGQPAVLGEILAGILLGPTVFGSLAPDVQSWLFSDGQILRIIAYLGLIAFVFIAGLEVDLTCIKQKGKSTLLISLSSIVLPFALGFGMVVLMPDLWGRSSENLETFALFMGTALSISALPVIARILMDLDLLKKEIGGTIMAAATIGDVIGWSLFALILSGLNSGVSLWLTLVMTVGLFVLAASAVYLELAKARGSLLPGLEFLAAVMLASSVASEFFGVHGIFAAFLAGVLLSMRPKSRDLILEKISMPVIGILAPIYFSSIGLKADFASGFDLRIIILIFVVACAGKILGAGIGALASGMPERKSLAVGFGLNARGAMEIVLASAALDYGLIDQRIFIALIIMALATTMISGSMIPRFASDVHHNKKSMNIPVHLLLHELKDSYNYFES